LKIALSDRERAKTRAKWKVVDELGYVPFTAVGSELLFEVFSQRYERGSTLVTSNLPFDEWTSIFGSERIEENRERSSSGRSRYAMGD
jgi:DNA replication protein DnaC